MGDHFCQYIVDFHMEPGEDGDPIFCDKPASIKWDGAWFCAKHYDEVLAAEKKRDYYEAGRPVCRACNCEFFDGGKCNCEFYMGVDLSIGKDATFSILYDNSGRKRDF
jgi:hypothetical protein